MPGLLPFIRLALLAALTYTGLVEVCVRNDGFCGQQIRYKWLD